MEKLRWSKIESELKKSTPITSMRDKESFWQEFNSRVVDIDQEVSREPPPKILRMTSLLMKVAACVAIASSVLFFSIPKDREIAVVQNKIKNLEVFTSYSAMIILNDDQSEGTIVWITDLTSN